MRERPRRVSVALFPYLFLLCLITLSLSDASDNSTAVPSDALAILAFKAGADVKRNALPYSPNVTHRFCRWPGVQCYPGGDRVVRLVLRGLDLGGVFGPNTLSRLGQLRVLSLQNDSLAGPIPDLSGLKNLKTLFLDHNSFSGSFPPSILSLHRIRTVELSHNNLTGPLPPSLASLDRLNYLRLEHNRLNGTVPAMNQSSLAAFNVSGNSLSGAVPVTQALLSLDPSSFSSNPGLCGEIVHRECTPVPPFFGPAASPPPGPPSAAAVNGVDLEVSGRSYGRPGRTAMIAGLSSAAAAVLVCCLLCIALARRRRRREGVYGGGGEKEKRMSETAEEVRREQERELEEKVKRAEMGRSGSLSFCAGESQLYSLDQLMRASAELLGRGSVGTTYKAVLDNRLIVCVKRLDASKLGGSTREGFESHMESVGGLRHPNLVPLRAYLQAKEERLLIYDYHPNGSLYSLIHGSKSTRAKPLHWTSCLKIAEDVAQGLSYIHQAWRLVHGNLNSRNVLLGPDFEACVSDYCLSVLLTTDHDTDADPDSAAYTAPEISRPGSQATSKSDVYAFGVLVLELVTGKVPAAAEEVASVEDNNMNNKMEMLVEVAVACRSASPEQRPTMWQVLKMLQEIKDSVLMEEDSHPHDHLDPLIPPLS